MEKYWLLHYRWLNFELNISVQKFKTVSCCVGQKHYSGTKHIDFFTTNRA